MNTRKIIVYGLLAVLLALTGCDTGIEDITKSSLTGNVTLNNNSPKVGESITATYAPGNGAGAQTWQWFRVGTGTEDLIQNAAANTYTTTTADEGKKIKVQLSFADRSGSLSAITTDTVTAANNDITYTAAQTGGEDGVTDSTGIVFTFSASVDSLNLSAADITVSGAAAKGASATLTGTGTSLTLAPITVNAAGLATVAIAKEGIEAETKHVTVYKEGESAPTLVSITAEYEPETAIFPDTTLDTLKEGLTVTAQYSDNSTAEVTDYTLSGELTVGESVITVNYTEGGVTKSADFTVTVNAAHVHNYGAWYTHTPATCTEAGVEREDCTADPPHHNEREIPIDLVNGHDYQWKQTTAPTCTAAGVDTEICTHNNSHTRGTRTGAAALGHDWETVPSTATQTANGIEGRVCNNNHAHDETTITYATGTTGLVFNLISINDGTDNAYRVHNGGDKTFTAVHIPAFHREDADSPYLPVTEIGNGIDTTANNAFGGTSASDTNTTLSTVTFAAESQLTTISIQAFRFCTSLLSISIPDSVTTIGTGAFVSCTSLASFNIPASVTTIGTGVFSGCTGLTSINIPEGVTSIGQSAFYNCTSLASVNIPNSVTSIGQTVFSGCTSLASITIGAGVTSIGTNAFNGCDNLRNIIIDNDKITSWLYIFTADNLSITFKKNPGNYAYGDSHPHYKLTSLTIEEGVTSIGSNAFSQCYNLTSVTIPASVTSIGSNAFSQCIGLASVTFAGTIPSSGFHADAFQLTGDLRAKFYATDTTNGTPGTYITTRTSGDHNTAVWTKQ